MDMKKTYETPKAEVERYQLDASIASNCETVVHNGPQMNGYSQCSDYIDPFETYSAARSVHNVQFYSEDTCDSAFPVTLILVAETSPSSALISNVAIVLPSFSLISAHFEIS